VWREGGKDLSHTTHSWGSQRAQRQIIVNNLNLGPLVVVVVSRTRLKDRYGRQFLQVLGSIARFLREEGKRGGEDVCKGADGCSHRCRK
jgi:hypothetical protein